MGFPDGFLWGAASAAYQIEGAYNEDGKTPGIWDALSGGHVRHGDTGNTACDHYHRFREDIALMKRLGLKAYRFSVSWPRVMPAPGVVNQKGLNFYRELVSALTDAGITPLCTLFHWNLPMWAHEQGGWLWNEVSGHFADYTRVVCDALSDKVSYWMTVNEPATFVGAGYLEGIHAPFETSPAGSAERLEKLCRLTRNVLLAHGKAATVLREHTILTPKIGAALDGTLYIPWDNTKEGVENARKLTFGEIDSVAGNKTTPQGTKTDGTPAEADQHFVNWWLEPIMYGKFHEELARYLEPGDAESIHQPVDFFGYNCYKANNYDDDDAPNSAVYPGLARTAMGWPVTPDALYWAVRFFYERYKLPVLITENGMANIDFAHDVCMASGTSGNTALGAAVPADTAEAPPPIHAVHDPQRIEYLSGYLAGLKRAVNEGYPVLGYLYWSLLDNFEWAEGYDKRFGLVYVDYRTQERIPKDSAAWYANIIKTNGASL